jgi:hypothetical protein
MKYMGARQDIEKYLGQWLELTQAEAGAIESSEWAEVRKIQSTKAALQKSLTAARERLMEETGGLLMPKAEDPLRAQIGKLVSRESRNADLAAAKLQSARAEQEKRAESLRNLRRLQRSYGRRLDAAWDSVS